MLMERVRLTGAQSSLSTEYFSIAFDTRMKIVRAETIGFWTVPMVETYFRALSDFRRLDPTGSRGIRILIDKRKSPVYAQDVVQRIRELSDAFYGSADRVASVMTTSLSKMQFRRTFGGEHMKAFLSISAAETWLIGS